MVIRTPRHAQLSIGSPAHVELRALLSQAQRLEDERVQHARLLPDTVNAALDETATYRNELARLHDATENNSGVQARSLEDHLRGYAEHLMVSETAVQDDVGVPASLKTALASARAETSAVIARAQFPVEAEGSSPGRFSLRVAPISRSDLNRSDGKISEPLHRVTTMVLAALARTALHEAAPAQDATFFHLRGIRTQTDLHRRLSTDAAPPRDGVQQYASINGRPIALIRHFKAGIGPAAMRRLEWIAAHQGDGPTLIHAVGFVSMMHFARSDEPLVALLGPSQPQAKRVVRKLGFTPAGSVCLRDASAGGSNEYFTLFEKTKPVADSD